MNLKVNVSEIIQHLHDPLLNNSMFIMLTSASSAGFGFIFWLLAAKLYSANDLGTASAIISSLGLIIMLSKFGLDTSIIRFFPGNDKKKIFSTSVIVTTFFAVLFGMIFTVFVDMLAPELHMLKSPVNAGLYLLFLAANSGTALSCISFVAVRKASFQFIQSIVVGSRIVFLIPFVLLGAVGIFCSVGISFIFALVTAYILLVKSGIRPGFLLDWKFLDMAFHYSAGNYIAGLFMVGPGLILPIIVLNVLGAEQAAYYYIAYAIATLIFKIPYAFSTSLFVEGSHGEELKKAVTRSLLFSFLLLIPASVILYVCSYWVLGLVNAEYATGGAGLLKLLIMAGLFSGVNSTYFAIKRVQKDVKELIVLSGIIGGLVIGTGYIFMPMFGVIGAGYAWLAGNGIGSVMVAIMAWRGKWI